MGTIQHTFVVGTFSPLDTKYVLYEIVPPLTYNIQH